MLGGDVVDQLLDKDGLADTGAAEQADLAALGVGADEVNDLDAGLQNFGGGLLLLIAGSGAVDGPVSLRGGGGLIVHRLTQQIEHAAQALVADGDLDGLAGVHGLGAAHQAVGAAHGDAAGDVVTGQLRHLDHQLLAVVVDLDGVEQVRQLSILELDVQHRADDLDHLADVFFGHRLQLLLLNLSVIAARCHLPYRGEALAFRKASSLRQRLPYQGSCRAIARLRGWFIF